MGLILLVVIGGVLGWLASIIARRDTPQGILFNGAVGIAGTLAAGLASNSGSILSGLSAQSLLIALAGALILLVLLNAFRGGHPS